MPTITQPTRGSRNGAKAKEAPASGSNQRSQSTGGEVLPNMVLPNGNAKFITMNLPQEPRKLPTNIK
jgi:hypothetical protein